MFYVGRTKSGWKESFYVKQVIGQSGSLPLSPAVRAGDFVFVSGQVGVDPRTNETGAGVKRQTEIVLQRIADLLHQAGASMKDVVKTTVFLKDIGHFAEMNEVYRTYFPAEPPARSTVQATLARPELLVEIECVAYCPQKR